jgi:hypothetical protein
MFGTLDSVDDTATHCSKLEHDFGDLLDYTQQTGCFEVQITTGTFPLLLHFLILILARTAKYLHHVSSKK